MTTFALVGDRVINLQHIKLVEFADAARPSAGCTVHFTDGSTMELKGGAAESLRQRLFPLESPPFSLPQ